MTQFLTRGLKSLKKRMRDLSTFGDKFAMCKRHINTKDTKQQSFANDEVTKQESLLTVTTPWPSR